MVTLFSVVSVGSFSQTRLEFTPILVEAYDHISSLRLSTGEAKLIQSKLSDPNNAFVYYIENYMDFYTLFIQEDQQKYRSLIKKKDTRLARIKASDSNSPYYLYCQAEIILQWATIKVKFDDKINAARDVYEAYNLLEENKKRFPNFLENNKSLSIIHALAESVPSWIRNIMGIKGSINLGNKEILSLIHDPSFNKNKFKNEIVGIYSYLLFYVNNRKEESYQLYDKYGLDHRTNPLVAFLKATMAQKLGRNEEAIKILEERPKGLNYLNFYYLDFMYGKFKLYQLDANSNIYLEKFVKNFGGRHYIKEAYQKLAWYHLVIRNDRTSYKTYINKCKKYGNNLIDEDKQALKEAQSNEIPEPTLLMARILFDGGYFVKAKEILTNTNGSRLMSSNIEEYYYRLGRISESLKSHYDAIEYYEKIAILASSPKYYACSAALQLGIIYEENKNIAKAQKYFKLCLALNPDEYRSSLHQKAKVGLDRIN